MAEEYNSLIIPDDQLTDADLEEIMRKDVDSLTDQERCIYDKVVERLAMYYHEIDFDFEDFIEGDPLSDVVYIGELRVKDRHTVEEYQTGEFRNLTEFEVCTVRDFIKLDENGRYVPDLDEICRIVSSCV